MLSDLMACKNAESVISAEANFLGGISKILLCVLEFNYSYPIIKMIWPDWGQIIER